MNYDRLFSLMKLCASYIDSVDIYRCFVNKLDCISEETFTTLLHLLHKALWSDEKPLEEPKPSADAAVTVERIMENLEVFLDSNCVTKHMHCSIRKNLLENIYLFLSSVQH
ncbi:hypothetical protein X975_25402, partial [Stegodyphus mimosarum]